MNKGLIITLAILAGLFILGVSLFSTLNSYQKEGISQETALSAQYLDNQNELSTYIATFYETIGVANLKSDKMDQILTDAVKGRYDGKTSAQPGQGQLFSAIVEAYPDIQNAMGIYDKIVDFIRAGREAFKQKQSKLLAMLQTYDNWRQSGLIRPAVLRVMGFPSNALQARIGTSVKRGQSAIDQMYLIVLVGDALKAYETGRQDPLPIPGSK